MFEHFGLRDVFCAINRQKKLIAIILAITIIVGVFNGYRTIKNASNSEKQEESAGFYLDTASYKVEPKFEITDENLSALREIPKQVASVLNTDFCKKSIYDKLITMYSKSDIIKKTALSSMSIKEEDINIYCLDKMVYSAQYDSSNIIQLYVETHDKELSKDILQLYKDYMSNTIIPNSSNANIYYIDSVYQENSTQDSAIEVLTSKDNNKTIDMVKSSTAVSVKKVMLKSVIVPLILVVALICIVIFVVELFNPKLNRREDFLEYDIPIIGELYINKVKGEGK